MVALGCLQLGYATSDYPEQKNRAASGGGGVNDALCCLGSLYERAYADEHIKLCKLGALVARKRVSPLNSVTL